MAEPSTWVNFWKMRSRSAAGTPMPVSRTSTRTRPRLPSRPTHVTATVTPPCAVNFNALATRFVTTWRMRWASPMTRRDTLSLHSISSRSPFSWAIRPSASTASSTVRARSIGAGWMRRRPASILAKSSRSSTSASRASPERWIMETISCPSASRSELESSAAPPMMLLSGVRISWLMLARNSLLARLDASAASLAASMACRARRRSRASRACAVRSATLPANEISSAVQARGRPRCSWHTTPTTLPSTLTVASSREAMFCSRR